MERFFDHHRAGDVTSIRQNTQRASLKSDALCIKNVRFLNTNLLLFCEEILYLVVGDNALLEDVGAGLLRLDHLDALRKLLTGTGFQRCNYFLCHIALKLFDFTVYGYSLQVRIVLLALQTIRGVLLVLGGDVARHACYAALLLLGALQYHLHSVAFLCHFSARF